MNVHGAVITPSKFEYLIAVSHDGNSRLDSQCAILSDVSHQIYQTEEQFFTVLEQLTLPLFVNVYAKIKPEGD